MSDRNVTPITFLPLEQIARAFAARCTGPNRYRARCPSCGGRSFKVSICAGNDGRSTLLYCFGGCSTEAVLRAAGLTFRDLYHDGPPPTPEERQQAQQEKAAHEAREEFWNTAERDRAARLRQLRILLREVGHRLALTAEGEAGDVLANIFHRTLDEVRKAEAERERVTSLRHWVEALDAADYARRRKPPRPVAAGLTHIPAVAS